MEPTTTIKSIEEDYMLWKIHGGKWRVRYGNNKYYAHKHSNEEYTSWTAMKKVLLAKIAREDWQDAEDTLQFGSIVWVYYIIDKTWYLATIHEHVSTGVKVMWDEDHSTSLILNEHVSNFIRSEKPDTKVQIYLDEDANDLTEEDNEEEEEQEEDNDKEENDNNTHNNVETEQSVGSISKEEDATETTNKEQKQEKSSKVVKKYPRRTRRAWQEEYLQLGSTVEVYGTVEVLGGDDDNWCLATVLKHVSTGIWVKWKEDSTKSLILNENVAEFIRAPKLSNSGAVSPALGVLTVTNPEAETVTKLASPLPLPSVTPVVAATECVEQQPAKTKEEKREEHEAKEKEVQDDVADESDSTADIVYDTTQVDSSTTDANKENSSGKSIRKKSTRKSSIRKSTRTRTPRKIRGQTMLVVTPSGKTPMQLAICQPTPMPESADVYRSSNEWREDRTKFKRSKSQLHRLAWSIMKTEMQTIRTFLDVRYRGEKQAVLEGVNKCQWCTLNLQNSRALHITHVGPTLADIMCAEAMKMLTQIYHAGQIELFMGFSDEAKEYQDIKMTKYVADIKAMHNNYDVHTTLACYHCNRFFEQIAGKEFNSWKGRSQQMRRDMMITTLKNKTSYEDTASWFYHKQPWSE